MDIIGREFGLTPEQTQAAVTALLPAISAGLKRSTSTPDGLAALLPVTSQQRYLRAMYDDPETAFAEQGRDRECLQVPSLLAAVSLRRSCDLLGGASGASPRMSQAGALSANVFEDRFEPGREVDQTHLDNIQNVLDQLFGSRLPFDPPRASVVGDDYLDWKAVANADGLVLMPERFSSSAPPRSTSSAKPEVRIRRTLDRGSACGHPNSYKIGQNTVAQHIETLIKNVFQAVVGRDKRPGAGCYAQCGDTPRVRYPRRVVPRPPRPLSQASDRHARDVTPGGPRSFHPSAVELPKARSDLSSLGYGGDAVELFINERFRP